MGKDNVPFHTLSFPTTILGSGEDWKLVDYIKSFNFLTYDGGQFSTSQGRGVFMDDALDILPSDYWRWWLLSHAPETSDSEFTWGNFQVSVNKDLADVLGNFISRVTKFCRSKFGETVPSGGTWGERETALVETLETQLQSYQNHLDRIEIRKAAAELRSIWAAGNEYLQHAAPWSTFKEDPEQAEAQIRLALNLIVFFAQISEPFLPDAADSIRASFGSIPAQWPSEVASAVEKMQPGHGFVVPDNLFAKVTDDQVAEWQDRFSGTG
jgi:methionyl-tRNA synthetase